MPIESRLSWTRIWYMCFLKEEFLKVGNSINSPCSRTIKEKFKKKKSSKMNSPWRIPPPLKKNRAKENKVSKSKKKKCSKQNNKKKRKPNKHSLTNTTSKYSQEYSLIQNKNSRFLLSVLLLHCQTESSSHCSVFSYQKCWLICFKLPWTPTIKLPSITLIYTL